VSTETTDWPYDADRTHPLAARRIPVVRSCYPGWKYEIALVISDEHALWHGVEPTALEADLIVRAIEYCMEYYNDSWRAKMRREPLDTDGTTNTVILRKRPDGGWMFRRDSWTLVPTMVPADRVSLPDLLDRVFGHSDGWEPAGFTAWKSRHAALIAAVRAEWAEQVAAS
jgi:hypothetical protein